MRIHEAERALKGYMSSHAVDVVYNQDPLKQLYETEELVKRFIRRKADELRGIKFVVVLKVKFTKLQDIKQTAYFTSPAIISLPSNDVETPIELPHPELLSKIDKWVSQGSGWVIEEVAGHYINIVVYRPLTGSGSYKELPKELNNAKKGLLNIRNKDDMCFKWCHIAHLYPDNSSNRTRVTKYKQHEDKVNYEGIEFPVKLSQVPKIEQQNNIGFNVFGYEDTNVFPLYLTERKELINILLIEGHYVLINDFDRLMFRQTKHKS